MKIKKAHVSLGLLVLIVSLTITGTQNQSVESMYKLETPRAGVGEITAVAPENKAYTESNSNYYPATYGFENEIVGDRGLEIDYIDQDDSEFPRTAAVEEINYDWLQIWKESGSASARDIILDNSSNIYLTGISDEQACLIKYTQFGQQIWNKTYSGISGVKTAATDDENNIYMAGTQGPYGNEDIFLLKVNQTGDMQWHKEWDNLDRDYAASIELNSNGDLYILGSTISDGAGDVDIVLLKYNQSGGLKWYKTWGYQWNDFGVDMYIDSDDNIFVVGEVELEWDYRHDICVIKYDSEGNQIFNSTWGTDNVYDHGYSIVLDSSQNIYVSGERTNNLLLVKFDSLGNYMWEVNNYTYGAGGSSVNVGNALIIDASDNLIISCYKGSSMGIVRYNKGGALLSEYIWDYDMYGESGNAERCTALLMDSFNNILIAGGISKDYTSSMLLMKCNSDFGTNKVSDMVFSDEKTFYEWFSTSMERIIISNTYRDRDWRAFSTFKIEGHNTYFLIYLIDKGFASNIKIYEKDLTSEIEHSLDVNLYTPYNFTYNEDIQFKIYFNYSHTYESCIRSDDGYYCDETEMKTVSGEYLSDYFSILKPYDDNSIPGFNIYLLINLSIILFLAIYFKIRKKM